jgi:hypothetical protein
MRILLTTTETTEAMEREGKAGVRCAVHTFSHGLKIAEIRR